MTRLSNWKEESDLFEVVTGKMTDKEALKKVDEKKGIKNKVVINPKLTEAIKELGGELIEATEEDGNGDTVDPRKEAEKKSEEQKKKQIENKQKRAQMIKKQVLMKKLIAVRQGSEDIVAHYEPDIEGVIEYFYEEGINEEGFDQILEEIGLEEFVDFVEGGIVDLNEERAARKMSVRNLQTLKKKTIPAAKAAEAQRKKEGKGEYSAAYKKKETDVTVYDDKASVKKKVVAKKKAVAKKVLEKPVAKKPVTKKVEKAVAKVKQTQPAKKATKQGLGDKIRSAYKAGVKRHRKATQGVRVFHKGMKAGAKKAVKFAKDVKKVVSEEASAVLDANTKIKNKDDRKKKEKEYARLMTIYNHQKDLKKRGLSNSYEPEGEELDERTLASYLPSDRQGEAHRANLDYTKIQLKKREDESTKNRGDLKKRDAGKMAKERLRNKKIMSLGEDKALELVRANIIKKHGKGAIYDPKKKQSPQDKAKVAAERKKRQDADNKAFAARAKKAGYKNPQDYANVVARYGSEDNYKKGRGLGT